MHDQVLGGGLTGPQPDREVDAGVGEGVEPDRRLVSRRRAVDQPHDLLANLTGHPLEQVEVAVVGDADLNHDG